MWKYTWTGICHGQQERLLVLELKVLVRELLSVDRLSTSAIACCEVTTLDHKLLDHSVECRSLVVERLARLGIALLSSAEGTEILSRLGNDIIVELECDTASFLIADSDIEIDPRPSLLAFL
jgi:hypothetical protein